MSPQPSCPPRLGEAELRRRIDVSLARALCDPAYEKLLLADPTILLGQHGCTPQQFLELRAIRAQNVKDFACQAEALFWPSAEAPARTAPQVAAVAAL